MISVKYQPLFSITLLHDYYANAAFGDVQFIPSGETALLLQNQKMICRIADNTLNVFVRTTEGQPFVPVDAGTVFRFYLKAVNSNFFNFTLLPAGASYFSNKTDNVKNDYLYLSAPVPAYKNTATYVEGDIVKKGSRVFECIKPNSKEDKHATDDAGYWRDIVAHALPRTAAYSDAQAYTTGRRVKVNNKMYECIKANSSADKHATADADYWQEITEDAYATAADTEEVPDKKKPTGTFATIDIFYNGGEKSAYAFLDGDNKVKAPQYFIRFKNRSTFWKYISQKQAISAITDTADVYVFSNTEKGDEFVSTVPVPLSFAPLQTLKMNATVNARSVEINGLQNPGVANIKTATADKPAQYYSEVYLNY